MTATIIKRETALEVLAALDVVCRELGDEHPAYDIASRAQEQLADELGIGATVDELDDDPEWVTVQARADDFQAHLHSTEGPP